MPRYLFDTAIQKILIRKLIKELEIDNNLSVEGVADQLPQVAVDFIGEPSQDDLDTAQAVIDAHDATDYEAIRQAQADTDAANIPGWASWTEAEATAWVDANVSNIASAKTALKAMARMIVALCNKQWPGLEDS